MQAVMELLHSRMVSLFWKIAEEKEAIVLDGMPGYNEKAQFVGGKVINQCVWAVTEQLTGTPCEAQALQALSSIIEMTAEMPMETWGILNGIEGLWRLHRHNLMETVIAPETLARFRQTMDWRTFVDVENDYALIHKPTNYYGVAFGIARYRELLGWDEPGAAAILLEHLLTHISTYSGSYGFMDETKGDGRFDRYSLLVASEVTVLLLETGWEVPQMVRDMLQRSAEVFLQMAGEDGTGIAYGRSIGAYGESAVIQTLSAAAMLGGIFTPEQERIALGYTCRLIRRMVTFWYDDGMQSINMWEHGRRTDGYRNKHRILGENLSLNMQLINSVEQWAAAGFTPLQEPEGWTGLLPAFGGTLVRFAKDTYDRCLVLIHDGQHVWQLPVISGGKEYFDKDPYLTVPRENLILEAVPDEAYGALVPMLTLADGTVLFPACFAASVQLQQTENEVSVSIDYPRLCVKPQAAV